MCTRNNDRAETVFAIAERKTYDAVSWLKMSCFVSRELDAQNTSQVLQTQVLLGLLVDTPNIALQIQFQCAPRHECEWMLMEFRTLAVASYTQLMSVR